MHDGMPYGRNQGQGQGHSREVDRQSPTGLILILMEILSQLTINFQSRNFFDAGLTTFRVSIHPSLHDRRH